MLTATEIAGFAGAGLAGAAYVPQIYHLVRARCSAGISRLAFAVWLLASLLVTVRAVAIHAGVFIVLGDTMSDYLIRQIDATPNVGVCYRVQLAGGTGTSTGGLGSLVLHDTASGERRRVPADALFVLIGSQPRTQWLGQGIARDQWGSSSPAPTCPPAPATTGPPAGPAAAGDQPARGVRRRRRPRRIGQTGRLRRRRRRRRHPPGAPLPANHRRRTSRRRPENAPAGQHPRPGLSQRPDESGYAHRAPRERQPTGQEAEMEQIMTAADGSSDREGAP